MKGLLFIAFLGLGFCLMAQKVIKDTVYINKDNMSHLVFYSKILHADYGANVVSSNNGTPIVTQVDNYDLVLIKAKKSFKDQTNMSVITSNNEFYDITILYTSKHSNNYYFFGEKPVAQQIEVENEQHNNQMNDASTYVQEAFETDSTYLADEKIYYSDTVSHYKIAKFIYGLRSSKVSRIRSTDKSGVEISLIEAYSRTDKLYLKFEIYNGRTKPFNIDQWHFFSANVKDYNRNVQVETPIDPLYIFNPKIGSVLPKRSLVKVVVFNHLGIDKKDRLFVQLYEKDTDIVIRLTIHPKYINNAVVFYPKYKVD